MFCPECKSEFRPGFNHCPDCDVDLVAELPPDPPHDTADLAELISTPDIPFLMIVKSLLESEGIPYLVQGEESLRLVSVLPSGGFGTPEILGAQVFVRPADLPMAQNLLRSAADPS